MKIRVELPTHLRVLARTDREISLDVDSPITQRSVLEALEKAHSALRGTLREGDRRRPLVRFFACGEDLSHEPPDALLPAAVAEGTEPFIILGAIAGG